MDVTFQRLGGRPTSAAKAGVHQAIALASARTGVDFNYLIGQAQVESGMNAGARATTSSARGLYQFIEQSWLGVVKAHGGDHGMAWAADGITRTASGRYVVNDPAMRQQILGLRNDPTAASLMAAEHASDNKDALEGSMGRDATGTDLYMAHFLGLGGARKFLGAMAANPDTKGAALFPAAARANRNIFYASDGSARSVSDIYDRFAAKLDKGAAAGGAIGLASDALDRTRALGTGTGTGDDIEVVLGTQAQGGDRQWLASTLDQLNASGRAVADAGTARPATGLPAALLRPKPENARLAYLMLASLGG